MPDVAFPSGAGTTPGYLAEPAAGSGLATIVLQEWWGLDQHIRGVCDRFAAEGFFALAPNLYRGEATTKPSEAQQKMMALSMQQAEDGGNLIGRAWQHHHFGRVLLQRVAVALIDAQFRRAGDDTVVASNGA